MCIRFCLSLSEIFNGNCTNLAVALLPKQENGKLSGNAYKTSKITLYCLKDEEYCRNPAYLAMGTIPEATSLNQLT